MNNLTSMIQGVRHSKTSIHGLLGILLEQFTGLSPSPLPLYIARSAPMSTEPKWHHWHPNTEVFFQLQGNNQFRTPTESFIQKRGDVVIMPDHTPHQETPVYHKNQWSHIVLALKKDAFTFHLTVESPQAASGKRTIAATQAATDNGLLLKGLIHEVIRTSSSSLQQNLFQAFCGLLLDQLSEQQSQGIAEQTLPLISRHLSDPDFSVGFAAEQLGCHPDSLSRSFKKKSGISFREYLCQQRMLLAESLLLQKHLEIAEVANLCGYRDHSYFSAEFRRHAGSPPSTYRNRQRWLSTQQQSQSGSDAKGD